jgi:hypothetical protein
MAAGHRKPATRNNAWAPLHRGAELALPERPQGELSVRRLSRSSRLRREPLSRVSNWKSGYPLSMFSRLTIPWLSSWIGCLTSLPLARAGEPRGSANFRPGPDPSQGIHPRWQELSASLAESLIPHRQPRAEKRTSAATGGGLRHYADQRKSRSRASSTMCSPDETALTIGG